MSNDTVKTVVLIVLMLLAVVIMLGSIARELLRSRRAIERIADAVSDERIRIVETRPYVWCEGLNRWVPE